jgi:hypothetical protein
LPSGESARFFAHGYPLCQFEARAAKMMIITTNMISAMNMAFTIFLAWRACFFSRAEILFLRFWFMVVGFYG